MRNEPCDHVHAGSVSLAPQPIDADSPNRLLSVRYTACPVRFAARAPYDRRVDAPAPRSRAMLLHKLMLGSQRIFTVTKVSQALVHEIIEDDVRVGVMLEGRIEHIEVEVGHVVMLRGQLLFAK